MRFLKGRDFPLTLSHKTKRILCIGIWTVLFVGWFLFHHFQWYPTQWMGLSEGCIIKNTTGLACWSCGLTRMFDCIIQLDLLQAFRYNPYFFLWLVIGLLFLIWFTIHSFFFADKPIKIKFHWWYAVLFMISLIAFFILRNTSWYLQYFYF